jgi:hypothetical protein
MNSRLLVSRHEANETISAAATATVVVVVVQ